MCCEEEMNSLLYVDRCIYCSWFVDSAVVINDVNDMLIK
jgi:hypothetical protein